MATPIAARVARLLKAFACAIHTAGKIRSEELGLSPVLELTKQSAFLGKIQMGLKDSSREMLLILGYGYVFLQSVAICFLLLFYFFKGTVQ